VKIAFVVNEFPCLSETFILGQITGLLDRGHDVDIYAARTGPSAATHADVARHRLLERTHHYATGPHAMPRSRLARVAKGLRFFVDGRRGDPRPLLRCLNFIRYGRRASSLKLLYEARAFMARGRRRYDVIQCHYGPNGELAVLLREVGVLDGPVVTSFHGYDLSEYVRSSGRDAYARLFALGDLFLPVSERWRDELIELGCPREKVVVHRMGVDTESLAYAPRGLEHDGRVHVLSVARLVEKKGLEDAIRAVAMLVHRHPRVAYKIVGEGPLRERLGAVIAELGVGAHCELLGPRSHEEVIRLMREADILLAPSVTSRQGDQEGVPVVIMEALALGLPVVSTRHSGIPEIVEDGRSGFLVREGDVDALAERLGHLMEHREAWAVMGRAGRERVEKYHDASTALLRLEQLYETVAASALAMGSSDSHPVGLRGSR
jgi:colanic acid/amylovoran biosynthesis glycosyltransferase